MLVHPVKVPSIGFDFSSDSSLACCIVAQVCVIALWAALISICLEISVPGHSSMFRFYHYLLINPDLLLNGNLT